MPRRRATATTTEESGDIWINRVPIVGSTGREYTVSQHRVKRHWACSCPGYRTHRKCRHLEELGFPAKEKPFEMPAKKGFMDVYRTAENGRVGTPDDWRRAAAAALPGEPEQVQPEPEPEVRGPVIRRIRRMEDVA